MPSSPAVRALRSAAAYDGRSASARIDRVEAVLRAQSQMLVKSLGTDALRDRLGEEEALFVIEAAGMDPAPLRGKWDRDRRERERASGQVSTKTGEGYEGDPRHDPRVTAAIMAGASSEALGRITAQVTAEYQARAEREARSAVHKDFMWIESRDGKPRYGGGTGQPLGVRQDAAGNPQQWSTTNTAVPALGSEEVGPPDMSDFRPRVPCSHSSRPDGKYCPDCGEAS